MREPQIGDRVEWVKGPRKVRGTVVKVDVVDNLSVVWDGERRGSSYPLEYVGRVIEFLPALDALAEVRPI
jgi:hypothetical protein